MHIFCKYINDSSFNMLYIDSFVKHTLYALYWNQHKFCEQEQMADTS